MKRSKLIIKNKNRRKVYARIYKYYYSAGENEMLVNNLRKENHTISLLYITDLHLWRRQL
jgi:hypothetical protein